MYILCSCALNIHLIIELEMVFKGSLFCFYHFGNMYMYSAKTDYIFHLTIDELTSELANTVTSKTLLEDQVQSLQQNLKDMTNNQRRLLKLWEDKKAQREQLSLPAIPQRPGQKPLVHKGVQTEMSISSTQILPTNAFETKTRRETDKSRTSLERRNITLANGTHREKNALIQNDAKGIHN
uniref:Zgc:113691 n=1 Tax=Cyprinus carpio TaxID=7962 RepID=A0A8C1Z1X4_CYPCA